MADTVVTSENLPLSSPLNPSNRIICRVCQKQFSQYTCPRCNSRYCSLHCYKSHSDRCTESFMRENVVEELRLMQPDDETKHKMLDILKRFHSEENMDSMDEDDSNLSEETIQKILSGSQVGFDDLSLHEKRLFQRAVASGDLSKMIEPWDPWWLKPSAKTLCLSQEGTQLVQQLAKQETSTSAEDDLETNQPNEIPPGPKTPLPPVSKLISTEPSPLLTVHLVDILYSYCFTLRIYNGDWRSDSSGSCMVLLSISSVLGQAGQPETVLEALSHCLEQTCSPAYRHHGGLQFGLGLLDDMITLLSLGTPALVCSLCDLQRLIEAGGKELKLEKPRKSKRPDIRSKLKLAERKMYFIMCWVHEQPNVAWSSLAAIIKAEKGSAMDFAASKRSAKMEDKRKPRGKVLIEEVQ